MSDQMLQRDQSMDRLTESTKIWDILVIGGGATGIAVAMDAASRGLEVALLERSDFGKGTSSRSTKLVHGGVRYLQQGNVTLVRDALKERTLLRHNAPHLVHDQPFLIPCRGWWSRAYYWFGLKIYDLLAGRHQFGKSHALSAKRSLDAMPTLRPSMCDGGVIYHDGQFDDTRLLIAMAQTANRHGACLANYTPVTGLIQNDAGKVIGANAINEESGSSFDVQAKCIINATGPFCDRVRQMDDASQEPMLATSQGVHLVLPRRFFPADTALIVPKTADGRVIFVIPWHDHVVVGTTDTPIDRPTTEPAPQEAEIEFLLSTAGQYLGPAPTSADVLAVFTGIRPLVRGDRSARTASLSRDHVIRRSDSGLLTITGGKWTTVRKMAEDCVDQAARILGKNLPCKTAEMNLHGYPAESEAKPSVYGSDWPRIEAIENERRDLAAPLSNSPMIRRSEVIWAVRHEMARTVEDVLARRTRVLFLNANIAQQIAPEVADLMAVELGKDEAWKTKQLSQFHRVAQVFSPKR